MITYINAPNPVAEYLRCVKEDGTVAALRPFETRAWIEMAIETKTELDAEDTDYSNDMRRNRWHQILEGKLAEFGGLIPDDRQVFLFPDLAAWQAWADRYERFDASIMLWTWDQPDRNPGFWQNFVRTGVPGYTYRNNMDEDVASIQHALKPLNARFQTDGRFEICHWRADFPSREDLVAFQLVYS